MAHYPVGVEAEPEGTGVHRGAQATAHRPEHVAAQSDRPGNQQQKAGQGGKGSLGAGQDQATERRHHHPEYERDETLAGIGHSPGRRR